MDAARFLLLDEGRKKALAYADKVKAIQAANLIGYWPLWEASGDEAEDISGNDYHGAYVGVTLGQEGIGDGRTCPLFDGANDYVNIYSEGLKTDFDGAEGTVGVWSKMSSVDVWKDSTQRMLACFEVGFSSRIWLTKPTTDDDLEVTYKAGGISKSVFIANPGLTIGTDWFHLLLTWSVLANEMKVYLNAVQQGSTQTGLGTWGGDLASTRTNIGANVTTPTMVFDGYLVNIPLWTIPLDATEIASLIVL